MLLHIFANDDASHAFGPDSPEAQAALEGSDRNVAQMIDAVKAAGIAAQTDIVVVSDHGFLPLGQQLQPNAMFKQDGLLEVNDRGIVTAWQAYFHSAGGSGFVYLNDPDDAAPAGRVRQLLDRLAADPADGVERVWTARELQAAGAAPEATFALTMKPGFYSGNGHATLLTTSASKGGHGFDPARPELHASLIMAGPDVPAHGDLGIIHMTQIGPTLAGWFGVQLSPSADKPLTLPR